jgi:hypothetical protein
MANKPSAVNDTRLGNGDGESVSAKGEGQSVQAHPRQSLREKLVILRLSSSQSQSSSSTSVFSSKPSLSNTNNMDASSKSDRRVMFRNWINSCLCALPDPSAMLLEIDRPAARSCSA